MQTRITHFHLGDSFIPYARVHGVDRPEAAYDEAMHRAAALVERQFDIVLSPMPQNAEGKLFDVSAFIDDHHELHLNFAMHGQAEASGTGVSYNAVDARFLRTRLARIDAGLASPKNLSRFMEKALIADSHYSKVEQAPWREVLYVLSPLLPGLRVSSGKMGGAGLA